MKNIMKRYVVDNLIFSGSHVISKRGLQDHGRPILDSVVREAVQNSLDAAVNNTDSKFVEVEFDIKDFETPRLTQYFEGLECLNDKHNLPTKYLAIRDKHTQGLSGSFFDEKSNLKKLVASYMQNQEQSGAGGSCGQGKTIYFRLGLGLVIFYSRVLIGPGKYESLLYTVLIQDPDPNLEDTIFPNINGSNPKGIVVWGKPIEGRHGEVQETRDEAIIQNVLDALNYNAFCGNETGTAVIIPFIKEEKLLKSNRILDGVSQYWENCISEYLAVSVQRWYSARLNNLEYTKIFFGSKALKVRINGELLKPDSERNFCKLLRTLYNKAALANIDEAGAHDHFSSFKDFPIEAHPITMNNIDGKIIGHLAYIIIPRRDLDIDNNSFYSYIDIDSAPGTPIVTYCRKPGMNIAYERYEPWVPSTIKASEDEYIIGYFVLKSNAQVKLAQNMSIEDYIRDGEQATHDSWYDTEIQEKYKPSRAGRQSFVKSLSEKVKNCIKDAITPNAFNHVQKKKIEGLGDLFGKVFLKNIMNPKGGRSVDSSRKPSKDKEGTKNRSAKNVSQNIEVSYASNGDVIIDMTVKTPKHRKSRGSNIELNILSASGKMTIEQWHKEVGTTLPFELVSIKYNLINIDDKQAKDSSRLNVERLYSSQKCLYGIRMGFEDNDSHSYECKIRFILRVNAKETKPVVNILENKEQ